MSYYFLLYLHLFGVNDKVLTNSAKPGIYTLRIIALHLDMF